ncbi:hypothetical protein Q0Z83_062540 [Actinoplanes sichuanensis]|uniref:DUF1877 family protein n=1 Tax=Actinoplanes sichuanensis TaxID=512349 RepID=A0ABW4A094_9ACTN|nr:DUF1877 family protein [Actinoplanes sichuanensis]BEL08063.1 hypothetical protein Q0Z83_062540 [Actinoplanes sichuanensis]
MSVITYFRRSGAEAVAELRRLLGEDVGKALEFADGQPGTHTDKAWAGLHFLLLDLDPPVDVFEPGEPFLILSAEQVEAAAAFFGATPFTAAAAGYDRALMESIGVYPADLWEADWALSYLEDAYVRVVALFRDAAAAGDQVVAWRA